MPTGIRFPSNFLPPNRDEVATDYAVSSTQTEFEIGHPRFRRKSVVQPRLERVSWTFSQAEYLLFDDWWHNTIRQGELLFDIELSDDDGGLIWYTVKWVGPYEAQINYDRYEWNISGVVRLEEDPFASRPVGTDELIGTTSVGISATGFLSIGNVMRGLASVGITATGRFSGGSLAGLAEVGIDGTGFLTEPVYGLAEIGIDGTGFLTEPVYGLAEVGIDGTGFLTEPVRGLAEVGITATGELA